MFNITLIGKSDGSVVGHKAGCADIKRKVHPFDSEPWTFKVANKMEAWANYSADFIAECDEHDNCDEATGQCVNAYDIEWLPCADAVPNTTPSTTNTNTVQEDTMSTMTIDTNTTTEFLLVAARDAYSTLRRESGQRAEAVLAFLNATSDEERSDVILDSSEGYLRRGLREAAVFFTAKDDEETANVFWSLRDMVTENGFDSDVVEVEDES